MSQQLWSFHLSAEPYLSLTPLPSRSFLATADSQQQQQHSDSNTPFVHVHVTPSRAGDVTHVPESRARLHVRSGIIRMLIMKRAEAQYLNRFEQ